MRASARFLLYSQIRKKGIEVNHSLIRRVLPKGTCFNYLTQEARLMNHINSYKRKKLNNCSPYETFSFLTWRKGLAKNWIHTGYSR